VRFLLDPPISPTWNVTGSCVREGCVLRQAGWLWIVLLLSGNCRPAPQPQFVIDEYLLSAPPDLSTDRLVFHFAQGDQEQILARTQAYRDFHQQVSEYNTAGLAPFGYSLKGFQESDHTYSEIYRGDQLLAADVVFLNPVSINASGTNFIDLVDLPDGQYDLTRDGLEKRTWPPGRAPYSYVGDRLLYVEVTGVVPEASSIQVYAGDELAYQSKFHNVSVYGPFDGPWGYDGHWALVVLDSVPDAQAGWQMLSRVVQDGKDLNTAWGYKQSFQFAVLDGQPFYFFEKASKIGISFAGREFAEAYDEVPHYQCCTGSLLNPGISMNMVWFFARRGPDWYYVQAYVPRTLK
jgi:hypothetical protein